jgi:signal transduction histidine kinase/ActR/RegA family two-component response regulator
VRTARLPDGGLVATYTDVTEKVRAADQLALANETLERRVRERTEELVRLNEELRRAKAAAEEANLGKTRFLAAASHDILQPLNAARLYATSLAEGGGDLARNLGSSLEAVEEILGALLDISRLDAGALKPEFMSFRLDELLRQIGVDFAPAARAKGLDLRIVPSSLTVRSDRRLLRRLLQNFVSNAVKYTGTGRVLIGCRRRGTRVRIEVHDTGPGIPKSKHKLVFREFQRLEEGARAARGLGLGLSIVERLGRVLGHRIDLESTPGRGSVFAVEVPRAASLPSTRKPAAPARRSARLDGLTALCIDNEAQILQGMEALLKRWGCAVLTAPDRQQALRALHEPGAAPDVLLVDYHLDDGNGLEAVAEIRAALGRDVPAVLITADFSDALREAARRDGVAVLNKPVKPAALRALLAQSRARSVAAE